MECQHAVLIFLKFCFSPLLPLWIPPQNFLPFPVLIRGERKVNCLEATWKVFHTNAEHCEFCVAFKLTAPPLSSDIWVVAPISSEFRTFCDFSHRISYRKWAPRGLTIFFGSQTQGNKLEGRQPFFKLLCKRQSRFFPLILRHLQET